MRQNQVGLRSHEHDKRVQDVSLFKGPVQASGEKQALVCCLFLSPYLKVGGPSRYPDVPGPVPGHSVVGQLTLLILFSVSFHLPTCPGFGHSKRPKMN